MSSCKVPVLYSYWRSSCSYRVRIALQLKGIQYDMKPVNIMRKGGEQHSNDYQKINPLQKVPALCIDGQTLVESVREICEMIQSGIQPLQNVGLLSHIEALAGKDKRLDWAQYWIINGFKAVEQKLTAYSGKYCIGDSITLADCCLIPQVYNARSYKVAMEQFPTITRIDKELQDHPAFWAAHPSQQPDAGSD